MLKLTVFAHFLLTNIQLRKITLKESKHLEAG